MIKTIDLFAGCGGFSCGFEKAGFNITTAVEYDKDIAESYKINHKNTNLIVDDIKNVDNNKIFNSNSAEVIIGGPPCQGFSMAGSRIRKNSFMEDERNYLFKHYFNIVKIVKPKIFIMENVKGILTYRNGEIFEEITNIFSDSKLLECKPYKIQYKIVKAKEYGIPQARERVIIIGSQMDFDLDKEIELTKKEIIKDYPKFFEPIKVWDAISDLNEVKSTDGLIKLNSSTEYQKYLNNNNNTTKNHIYTNHNKTALNRIKKVKINENYSVLNEKINSVHSGAYGRLDPNGIANTITTRFDTPSGGKFIHPFHNRTITPREAARIQSFPDSFEFIGSKTCICKQIGNAVPPKLAYFFGRLIGRILNEESR